MSFNITRNYKLDLSDTDMDGADIILKHTTVGTTIELRNTMTVDQASSLLASHLVKWDLVSEEGPIGTDKESILEHLDEAQIILICTYWLKAATSVGFLVRTPEPQPEEPSWADIPMQALP